MYYFKFLKYQYYIVDQIQRIIFLDRKTQFLMIYSNNQNVCVEQWGGRYAILISVPKNVINRTK